MNKEDIILSIDTSSNTETIVTLCIGDTTDTVNKSLGERKSQHVLEMIDEILRKHDKSIQDLTAISVVTGPGSYTGLRVGVAVANALAYAEQIPINGNPIGTFVEPEYA